MDCKQAHKLIEVVVTGDRAGWPALARHFRQCRGCHGRFEQMSTAWAALDVANQEDLPSTVDQQVLQEVSDAFARERQIARPGWRPAVQAASVGLAASVLSAFFISLRVGLQNFALSELIGCTAVWAVCYGLVVWLVLGATQRTPDRTAAITSLSAATMGLVAVVVCPLGHAVQLCRPDIIGAELAAMVAGAIYGALSMLVGNLSYRGAPRVTSNLIPWRAVGMFLLLAAPGVYLQSQGFTMGMLLTTLGGIAIGTVGVAALAGLRFRNGLA